MGTMICKFRHLLERNKLVKMLLMAANVADRDALLYLAYSGRS